MAYPAPHTSRNFQITFLLTQLLEALYEDLPVQSIKFEVYHHFSGLSFMAEVSFWRPLKTVVPCDSFIIIIIIIIIFIYFFRCVFSECTEMITISLIPLETILPEKCAFIIGSSCTVWTKMRSLSCSLADGMLTDTVIIPPLPLIPPTFIRKVRGLSKKLRKHATQKPFTSKWKMEM